MFGARALAFLLTITVAMTSIARADLDASMAEHHGDRAVRKGAPKVLDRFVAPDGRRITLYQGAVAYVDDPKHHTQMLRYLPHVASLMATMARLPHAVPDRKAVLEDIALPVHDKPFVENEVVAVFRPGTRFVSDDIRLSNVQVTALRLPGNSNTYAYSNDANVNHVLSAFGTRESVHLFAPLASRIASMRSRAPNASATLPIENAYLFHLTRGHVRDVVAALRALPSVVYAGENLRVSTMNAASIPLPEQRIRLSESRSMRPPAFNLQTKRFGTSVPEYPENYDVVYSGQSLLNAPGTNAIAAYDEIAHKLGVLPGAGEIITNVSLGDIDDGLSASDPCTQYFESIQAGPTTIVKNHQHYLDFPAMPLIPAFTANQNGETDGMGEVCGVDPTLGEVGLDFSVMATLPHRLQRPGRQAGGLSDLLGLAPGAQYRLVVPSSYDPGTADIVGALLGAALQSPTPNVITASIGLGDDQFGFPDRYLEEDPIARSAIAAIVAEGIVVCIASGDGLREYTNTAVGPSGGTVPIDVAKTAAGGTDPNDDELSTIPSAVVDSGSIVVGGTTLDDVTTNPPVWSANAKYRDQLAYPEVRWNGFGDFASAYGPRVNISAPSDNILAIYGDATASGLEITGGTSAAAPEVAAAASVAMQIAKAVGKPLATPQDVRTFLVSTATSIPNVAQADQPIDVGPQLNLGHAVEKLLKEGGDTAAPSVGRIAVAQRYPVNLSDFAFTTDTDPAAIDLTGNAGETQAFGQDDPGVTAFQPITIAPDWEFLPPGTRFKLDANGTMIPAPNPWARLYPATILKAAGLPLYSVQPRKVELTYRAYSGSKLIAETSTTLTFLANAQTLTGMGPAPLVPPVVTGKSITVQYDLSNEAPSFVEAPTLYVTTPGRPSVAAPGFHIPYSVRLTGTKGTVIVPVSALQGDGIYGFGISPNLRSFNTSTWAYTRVATAGSDRPSAPLLGPTPSAAIGENLSTGHVFDVPYRGSFQLTWDASTVPKATGAMLEISAPGPTLYGNYNTFNNPNGSVRDDNGLDRGSQVYIPLPGVKGSTMISSSDLLSAEFQQVRIVPMNGNAAVGEASDVSTIITHGIQTSDGGSVTGGFEINPQGIDGMVASNDDEGTISSGNCDTDLVAASLEALNLTAAAPGATVKSTTQFINVGSNCGTSLREYYAMNDLGFDSASDSAFAVEGPLGQNTFNGDGLEGVAVSDWIPNVSQYAIASPGPIQGNNGFSLGIPTNQQSTPGNTGVLYSSSNGQYIYQLGPNDPQVFSGSVSGSSFTWNNGTPFGNYLGYGPILGFAAVPSSKSTPGYAIFSGDNGQCCESNPVLDVLDLSTGKASFITNLLSVGDLKTGLAVVPNAGQPPRYVAGADTLGAAVGFYDFAAATLASSVNTTASWPAAITPMQGASGRGYVAVLSAFGPNYFGAGNYYFDGDDNVLSGVDVVAPNGGDTFISTSNLLNLAVQAAPDWIGYSRKTHSLYVLGPNADEIQVIPTKGF